MVREYPDSTAQSRSFYLPSLSHLTDFQIRKARKEVKRPFTRIQSFIYGMKELSLSTGFISEFSYYDHVIILFLKVKWQKPHSKDTLSNFPTSR